MLSTESPEIHKLLAQANLIVDPSGPVTRESRSWANSYVYCGVKELIEELAKGEGRNVYMCAPAHTVGERVKVLPKYVISLPRYALHQPAPS